MSHDRAAPPSLHRQSVIRVFKSGRHAHRTPLSYPAFRDAYNDRVALVARPEEADCYVFAHVLDIAEAPQALIEDWRRRHRPVLLLSEEPFWDTIWARRPGDRHILVDTDFGMLPVVQINHVTSGIFTGLPIPYYLLTNLRFETAYRTVLPRLAAEGPERRAEDWLGRSLDAVFMFERRPERYHDASWPGADLHGLCAWRTDLAEMLPEVAPGFAVERYGLGWQPGPRRQDLPGDWHADKLERLSGLARFMGAVENTHHPDYLTEKFFDALACGSVPIYVAGPRHCIHQLNLPEESWINLYDLSPGDAAARLEAVLRARPPTAALQAAIEAAALVFAEARPWQNSRQALADRVVREIEACLGEAAP